MDVVDKRISITELKRLIYELRDKQPYTGIRFRFLGEMWQQGFLQIFNVNESYTIWYDEVEKRLFRINDLSMIVQFEVDHNFQQYLAHFHYKVSLDNEYIQI